ncbi:MAG: TolC family protein [Calditrichia bacterium]|nr:TolC family protein [Calditrichia bacterium]
MRVLSMSIALVVLLITGGFAQEEALSLQNCIEIALTKNPNLVRTLNLDESAGEDVTASYAGILPAINLDAYTGRYQWGEQEYEASVPVGRDSSGNYIYERRIRTDPADITNRNTFGVSVSQNIFDGGEWWQAISYAKSQKRASEYTVESMINSTVLSVQEAFFSLLKQQKLYEVNQIAVTRSEDNLNKTEKMFELGAVAKVDVYRSRVNLGNDKIQMLLQKNAVLTARQQLNLVMGRDPQTPLELKPEFDLPSAFPEVDELFNQAKEMNPDLKKGEEDVNSYDLMVSRSWAVIWPSLGAGFSYDRRNEGIERVYKGWDKNWSISWGVSLSWNLFNGFRDKVRIQQSKLALRNVQETYEETRRNLKSTIVQLVDNFNSYLEIIDINEDNLEAAQEEHRLASERYRIGSGTSLEVREAQVNLTRAEQTLVAAKYNARMSQAQLEQALGVIYKKSRETSE